MLEGGGPDTGQRGCALHWSDSEQDAEGAIRDFGGYLPRHSQSTSTAPTIASR